MDERGESMSDNLIKAFIVAFSIGAGLAAYERNPGRLLYFAGAAVLNIGILFMK